MRVRVWGQKQGAICKFRWIEPPRFVRTPIYLSWCLSLVINRICAFALDAARWLQWATMSNLLPPSPSACKSGRDAMQILFYSHQTMTMTMTIYKCARCICMLGLRTKSGLYLYGYRDYIASYGYKAPSLALDLDWGTGLLFWFYGIRRT